MYFTALIKKTTTIKHPEFCLLGFSEAFNAVCFSLTTEQTMTDMEISQQLLLP